MKIGRKLFYDLTTGDVLLDTGDREGAVRETTVEQDVAAYRVLSMRNRDTFDVLELPFGAYAKDFAQCTGYRVNVQTSTLEFSYPDPGAVQAEPVYQAPLTEKVATLEGQLSQTNTDLQGFMDFYFSQ